MFNKKTDDTKSSLDDVIDDVYRNMLTFTPDDENYATMMNHLAKLHEIKGAEKRSSRVSPDTLAIVAGNLLGIGMILSYEHTHAVTSKALSFVLKAAR